MYRHGGCTIPFSVRLGRWRHSGLVFPSWGALDSVLRVILTEFLRIFGDGKGGIGWGGCQFRVQR